MPRFPLSPRSAASTALLSTLALAACDTLTDPAPAARPALAVAATTALIPVAYAPTVLPLIPAGINDGGAVVGTLGSFAARWTGGAPVTLPTHTDWNGSYEGRAINKRGSMVGNVVGGPGMYWTDTDVAPIVIKSPADPDYNRAVTPRAINNSEVVVGSYEHFDKERTPDLHAFRWTEGKGLEDITPGGYDHAVATDINDEGYIVGYAWLSGQRSDAVRWKPGATSVEVIGKLARANAVRSNGSAVAVGTTVGTLNAYLDTPWAWSLPAQSGPLTAPQQSEVTDVSNSARVVGYAAFYATVSPGRPWTTFDGGTTWLPVPNERETDRVVDLRVNACGSIVGTQRLVGGGRVGLLWTKFQCDLIAPSPF
jgi:hypothetical protein